MEIPPLLTVAEAQKIAAVIFLPDSSGFWKKSGLSWLTAIILHAAHKARAEGRAASLTDVERALSAADPDTFEIFETGDASADAFALSALREMRDRPAQERAGVLATCQSALSGHIRQILPDSHP